MNYFYKVLDELKMYDILVKCPLFHGLDSGQLESLFNKFAYNIRAYNTNDVVAWAGDEVSSLIIVLSGSVRGEMPDISGKVIKIEDIPAPFPVATAFIFGANRRFPVNITANGPVRLMMIRRGELIRLLQSDGLILESFIDLISNRAQFLSGKIRFFTFKPIKGKIAQYIVSMGGLKQERIRLGKTHQEIADLFGVTRPSVSRGLRQLTDEGIIELKGKTVKVVNPHKLIELIR